MVTPAIRLGIRKPNSGGLIVATAGNDLVHTLGTNRSGVRRSAIIRKIMAYNATGADVTLQFGTRNSAAVPAFVQLLPTLLVLNALDNTWEEADIPAVEFVVNNALLAAGREGNIYLLASAAAILVSIEVEEFGS